ncbi:hypothetical protein BDC45DRAFT_576446 [Circinella umbellata]|nr:hypothetical protein BDC45DRAFT_576446 [Circinella umbellata]
MSPLTVAPHLSPTPIPLKVLGYADDVFLFLYLQPYLERLDLHLSTYQKAFNAKLNSQKIISISLSGKKQQAGNTKLVEFGFPVCHNYTNLDTVEYLGFPLFSTKQQLHQFLEKLHQSNTTATSIFSSKYLFAVVLLFGICLYYQNYNMFYV